MSGSVDLGGRRIIKKIFFKQKTAYEIVTGDWSSDVCSSDLSFTSSLLPSVITAQFSSVAGSITLISSLLFGVTHLPLI